jgi:hypothetical protein
MALMSPAGLKANHNFRPAIIPCLELFTILIRTQFIRKYFFFNGTHEPYGVESKSQQRSGQIASVDHCLQY